MCIKYFVTMQDLNLQILKILESDGNVLGQNTIEYLKGKILDHYPEEKIIYNDNRYDSAKKRFNDIVDYEIRELLKSGFIEPYEAGQFTTINNHLATENITYYYISNKGKAALKDVELHGFKGGRDWECINAALGYMSLYDSVDLFKISQIVKELEYEMNIENCKSLLLYQGFCEDLGNNLIILTKKGRRLKKIGSIEEYNKRVKSKKEEKETLKQLNLTLINSELINAKIQKDLLSLNAWIAFATIVVAIQASFQLVDYYEKYSLDVQNLAYFLSGLLLGLILWLLAKQLWRLLRKRKT